MKTVRGFTLVEVMIVIAIIAIIASLAIPNIIAYRNTAHAKACQENMAMIRSACLSYQVNHGGAYTENQEDLKSENGLGLLRGDIICPIGGEYTITYDSQKKDFSVTCSKNNAIEHNVNSSESTDE